MVRCNYCKTVHSITPINCEKCGVPYSGTTFSPITPTLYPVSKIKEIARLAFSYGFDGINEQEFEDWFKTLKL